MRTKKMRTKKIYAAPETSSGAGCGAPIFRSGSSERQMQAGLGKIATDCL